MPPPVLHANFDYLRDGDAAERRLTRVSGWAFAETGPLRAARVVVDDDAISVVTLGIRRPDVAEHARLWPQAETCGWEADVDLRDHPRNAATLTLLVRVAAGDWVQAAQVELELGQASAPAPGSRSRAAFTIVKDEAPMLARWLAHYGRSFDPADLYVLDHASTDGGTSGLAGRATVIPVHRDSAFEHRWLRHTVQRFQAFLLQSYKTVVFAEVDEMIVADPRRHEHLGAYIEAMPGPSARCSGFNVVHLPAEPPLDPDRPVLAQRSTWHASLEYSKRLVSRVPLRWIDGFHVELSQPDGPPDPDLLLVHLHRADHDACLARHRASAARRWLQEDLDGDLGSQNRIADPEAFEAWFSAGDDLDAPPELIPAHLRNSV